MSIHQPTKTKDKEYDASFMCVLGSKGFKGEMRLGGDSVSDKMPVTYGF